MNAVQQLAVVHEDGYAYGRMTIPGYAEWEMRRYLTHCGWEVIASSLTTGAAFVMVTLEYRRKAVSP